MTKARKQGKIRKKKYNQLQYTNVQINIKDISGKEGKKFTSIYQFNNESIVRLIEKVFRKGCLTNVQQTTVCENS